MDRRHSLRIAWGVVPQILIVGDDPSRSGLAQQVTNLGYEAAECGSKSLTDRLSRGPVPAAIMLCVAGADAAVVMAQLRRSREGAAIPVTLCGRLGGAIRDLADVLDLGADHFLEEPIVGEQLASALEALAGPAPTPLPKPTKRNGPEDRHAKTEVIATPRRELRKGRECFRVAGATRRSRDRSAPSNSRTCLKIVSGHGALLRLPILPTTWT